MWKVDNPYYFVLVPNKDFNNIVEKCSKMMKMGCFWRKHYDPYKENTVSSPPRKDRAVKKMTPCDDCSQLHVLIDGMCPGNVWPSGYHGILLESNKNYTPEIIKILGMQKIS